MEEDFGMCFFKRSTKAGSDLATRLFQGFPRLGNFAMKMISLVALRKGDLLERGCETRSHRTREGRVQYERKVWEVLERPYTLT